MLVILAVSKTTAFLSYKELRMLQKIVIVGLLCLMSWGCNTTEETKKIDLEPIKENREGLDYSSKAQESLFIRLDQLLVQWHAAQKKDNRPASSRQ